MKWFFIFALFFGSLRAMDGMALAHWALSRRRDDRRTTTPKLPVRKATPAARPKSPQVNMQGEDDESIHSDDPTYTELGSHSDDDE